MSARKEVPMLFDTLAYAKKLEASGVNIQQAETHASALAEVLEANFGHRDTALSELTKEVRLFRKEFDTFREEMNTKFGTFREEINAKFYDLIKWVFGISFAQAAFIISALKFFH